MDFEEWEYIPDARFLDLQEDGEKKISKGKRGSFSKSVFDMDDRYFACSLPKSNEPNDCPGNSRLPKLVPLPIQMIPSTGQTDKDADEIVTDTSSKVPAEDSVFPSVFNENIQTSTIETDQDTVSQVFFKVKENEFVDMKMDSPMSGSRGFLSQIEAGKFQFEDKESSVDTMSSPRMKTEKETTVEKQINRVNSDDHGKEKVNWDESSGGLNLWKWTLNGVGAICSIGFAATICILVFGNQQRKVQHNPKIQFQMFTDDKSIKRVVQQAAKLNEVISAVRGVPLNRAQITVGGHYDAI